TAAGLAGGTGFAALAAAVALPLAAACLSLAESFSLAGAARVAALPLAAGFAAAAFEALVATGLLALPLVALDAVFDLAAVFWGLRVGAMSSPAVGDEGGRGDREF